MHLKRVTTLLMALFLSVSLLAFPGVIAQKAIEPTIKCYSDVTELGDPTTKPDVTDTLFDVAVVVEDVEELYGLDLQFNWTTEWIEYQSYQIGVPVETYSSVMPPSPYAGILHQPFMELKKLVDEGNAFPGGEPGAMAWFSYSSMAGAPTGGWNASQNGGGGTVVVFTFKVVDQPFTYEANPVTIGLNFILTSLSFPNATGIDHVSEDLEITLYAREFEYAPRPMLKVTPELVTGYGVCETFEVDVWLMDENGDDLSTFWDVAGVDFYLNFNTTILEGIDVEYDPDGDFAAFWADGILHEIPIPLPDNVEGYVHAAFFGLGEQISPVEGTIRVATITFHVLFESDVYPPPITPIYLEEPLVREMWYILDAKGVIINLEDPVSTDWSVVYPSSYYGIPQHIQGWDDEDGDGKLSVGDQVELLNEDVDKWWDYYVASVDATLNLTQLPFQCVDDYIWATDSWTVDGLDYCGLPGTTTASHTGVFDGQGSWDWTGNFSVTYPFVSVNSVTANFVGNGSSRVLTEGVDYKVYPDEDKIELLVPIDVDIINEHHLDVNGSRLDGWPWINYSATSIQSVYVDFHNGTAPTYAPGGFGCFQTTPPCAWWYEPDYPCELEGWWVLGYFGYYPDVWYAWPMNSEWWINYTAGSYLTVDYNAEPDPRPFYMEMDYEDYVALGIDVCTYLHEVYPHYSTMWHVIAVLDGDASGDVTVGDTLTMNASGMIRDYDVNAISTNMEVIQKPCVQDIDTGAAFYTHPLPVRVSGLEHPDRPMSPWFGREGGMPLPAVVEDGAFEAPFAPPGRWIDLITCSHPPGYKGEGLNEPCDAFGPQETVCLCAEVTYNLNPVQQKKVTFEIQHGEYHFILCEFTDENGIACVEFGLPWPCDDPEGRVFGTWHVIATVDIREVVVMDTMDFEVGYLIEIVSVEAQPDDIFEIGEHMGFKITYRSISEQKRTAYFTIVIMDDLDVPIGWMIIGPINVEYEDGENQFIVLECMEVPKHCFVGQGTVHVNILNKLPSAGGVQYCAEETIFIGLVIPP